MENNRYVTITMGSVWYNTVWQTKKQYAIHTHWLPQDYSNKHVISRESFVNAPSQWETTLHCNVLSHWLGAFLKQSLPAYLTLTYELAWLFLLQPRLPDASGVSWIFTTNWRQKSQAALEVLPEVAMSSYYIALCLHHLCLLFMVQDLAYYTQHTHSLLILS